MQDMQDTRVGSLCREDPLEEDMATHSSILAQKISWTEEAQAGYSPWGRKGAGHDLATEQVFWVTPCPTSQQAISHLLPSFYNQTFPKQSFILTV